MVTTYPSEYRYIPVWICGVVREGAQEKRTTKMLASRLSNSLRAAVGRRAIGGFALPTDAGTTVAEKVCVAASLGRRESTRKD